MIVPALARMSLRSLLRSRRFVVAALVALIPVLLGAALLAVDASQVDEAGPHVRANVAEPLAYLVLGGTIPFIAMLLAGSVVADDVEDRTFSYILVRPLRRHQVYLSRLLPAALVAAALAVAQVFAYSLLRLLSWSLYGRGATETIRGVPFETWQVIIEQGGIALGAAALTAVAFLSLFSFVTVLTTKYHFLANLLIFLTLELPFGNLGGRGAGMLTITYHARSMLYPASEVHYDYNEVHWAVAVAVLLAMCAFWTAIAAKRMGSRDFNVTSAAS